MDDTRLCLNIAGESNHVSVIAALFHQCAGMMGCIDLDEHNPLSGNTEWTGGQKWLIIMACLTCST